MDNVVHFEIPTDDLGRAKKFYADTFGWEVIDMPELEYTLVHTVETDKEQQMPKKPGAINGGMFPRQSDMPNVQVHINVKSIDESLDQIKENGGEVVREKTPVGDMGFVANFKDSEGNVLGLWESNN